MATGSPPSLDEWKFPPQDSFLRPGGRYFGCRHCHDLTYHSAQTHNKRVDALRRNPELLAAIVDSSGATLDGGLLLALKALR